MRSREAVIGKLGICGSVIQRKMGREREKGKIWMHIPDMKERRKVDRREASSRT